MIELSELHKQSIYTHGTSAFPYECCGAMLGHVDWQSQKKTVTELVILENVSTENKHRRFSVSASDYKALEKSAKEKQLTLLGFYHTHPSHPCVPSETDLNYAWPFFSYIILSVFDDGPRDLFSFVLDSGAHQLVEETLLIVN